MPYQQLSSTSKYQKISIQTQSRLIDAFFYHKVPQFYQNIFINYIKTQSSLQAQLSKREQIQSLSNNSSFIQSYLKCSMDKEKYEGYIRVVLSYQKQTYESQAAKIIKICELIMHLRDMHFKCVNFLLEIRHKYESDVQIYQSIEKYYYNTFAIKLDSFRKELQRTYLSHYIDFQKEYDPFFIHLKYKKYHNDQKCNKALQLLMQFSVEDSYKYLKMEKIMIEWLYMHSKSKILQKRLERVDLPQFKAEKDNFGENMSRYQRQFNRDNELYYFRKNRSLIEDMDSADDRFDPNRDLEMFSLEKYQKYQKQQKQIEKQKLKRDYLNDNINKLLQRNILTPQKAPRYKFRVKTQSSSKEPVVSNGSTFVGKIKRFKISNVRTLQNSPLDNDSKRSETLPINPRQQLKKYNFNINKNQQINTPKSPKYFFHDSQNNLIEQKARSISKDSIKLQKINAYAITIGGKKNTNFNQPADTIAASQGEMKRSNKNQNLTQSNQNVGSKKIDPELTSTLRQSQDFKSPDSDIEGRNKRQVKLTRSSLRPVKEEPEKYENARRQNKIDRGQSKERIQQEQKQAVKRPSLVISNKYMMKEKNIKQTDEEMDPALPTKRSDQEDLIKQMSTSNPPKTVQQTYHPYQPKINTQPYQPKTIYESLQSKNQEQPTTDKSKQQLKKQQEKTVTLNTNQKEQTSKQNNQNNNVTQIQKSKTAQKQIKQRPPVNSFPAKEQNVDQSQSNLKSNEMKEEKRQIKMRVGKYTLSSFKEYLEKYQFHKDSLKIFDIDKISKELQFQQTYITQYLVNGKPAVLAIIYLISNCKPILRMWALQEKQDQNLSFPILKKFIDYIQKQCTSKYIYYKGVQFPELIKVGFVQKKDDLFQRKRTTQPRKIQQQFQQCIFLQCSQIKFTQKQIEDILVSAQIQNFTIQNSKMSPFLTNMKEETLPPQMKDLIKISHKIGGFAKLNEILQKEDLDNYQATSKIVIQNIDLSLLNFLSNFRDIFVASEGFIKLFGYLVKQTKQQAIYSIKLTKNNGRVCFCRGYNSAQQVQNDLKVELSKKQEFWVPMFNKKLYGRYKHYKSPNQVCYANWDISFSWQDELQGALKYPQRGGIRFEQASFYVSIQLQDNLLYIFKVNGDDYIY